jgi:hypothetical protein
MLFVELEIHQNSAYRSDSMTDEITDLIISKLGKHKSRNEIIIAVCEKSGLDWSEAESLVERVEEEHHRPSAARQSPVLILISSVVTIAGLGLLGYCILFFVDFFQVETFQRVLLLKAGYLRIISMLTGLGMIGGAYTVCGRRFHILVGE